MLDRYFNRREQEAHIDEQIDAIFSKMNDTEVDSEEYSELINHLERLEALKLQKKQKRASRDTWLVVGGNFMIAVLVVVFEKEHVWTSRVQIPFTKSGPKT